jgi:DNA polymerase-3 subunit delta'
MGIEAQNSFLKTLEEPPRNTMLLLTTTRARLLLPTIRSRCQNILLLKNKVDYSSEVPEDFLKILARMHRNAGSRAAFDCVEKINVFLHSIREKAEEYVEENWDGAWDAVAENDRSIQKQLAEMKLTRVETEYLRRRNVLLECLSAWFQQRALQAAGAARLPQPEFIPFMQDIPVPTPDEAEEDLRSVTMFLKALNANVTEDIAIYALCLEICRKKR